MNKKFILSGGGTGGHIYPAVAIADALKQRYPDAEFLFVGAQDKMEMEKVPQAGYTIEGLWISGLQRKISLQNLSFPFKVISSLNKAKRILKNFAPDAVIGTGGFASGPILYAASQKKIPTLIQEQNALPGITNKILSKKVDKICVAYETVLKYFPTEKTLLTGNPVRKDLENIEISSSTARLHFGLQAQTHTLLVLGGSLGAGKINELIAHHLDFFKQNNIQLLWQTGKYYFEKYRSLENETVKIVPFIKEMQLAYAAADVIVSRAGALTVSELCLVGKAVIFIPSPNVAEDHQTKNAQAMADKNAALLINENEADDNFSQILLNVFEQPDKRAALGKAIKKLAKPHATNTIVTEIAKLIEPPNTAQQNLFFLGIGGIGMSALARHALKNKAAVAGYDKVESQLTRSLTSDGATIFYEDEVTSIPLPFRSAQQTQVIYTPAVPKNTRLFAWFEQNGFQMMKRSEWLGQLTREHRCLAIAGTHGKTTTSTLLAHLLKEGGQQITAFLGGISQNYHTNFLADGADALIVEADEFDRSFHRLSPFFSAVTSTDADHLDIYGSKEEMLKAYEIFAKNTQPGGKVFVNENVNLKGIKYGFIKNSDYRLTNIRITEGKYCFDIESPKGKLENLRFGLPGKHNLSNALLATVMALEWGLATEKIALGLASFQGVERRFTRHIDTAKCVFIDDYAHHPTEIKAVFEAVNSFYPNRKKTVLFQPHLFSRTRDFMKDFADALSAFDRVWLAEIYPARELPIAGIDSRALLDLISIRDKKIVNKQSVLEALKTTSPELLLVLGAGDIAEWVEPIKKCLET